MFNNLFINNNDTLKCIYIYIYGSRNIKVIYISFFFEKKKIGSESLNFTSNRTRNMNAESPRTNDNFKKFITIITIGCRSSLVIYFENKKEI